LKLKGPNGIVRVLPIFAERYEDHIHFDDSGEPRCVDYIFDGDMLWLSWRGLTARYSVAEGTSDEAGKEAVAPMTGKVVAVPVQVGQSVKEGDTLAILEAMKMEYRLEAEADGEVAEIGAEVGELVDLGHVLVRLK
jgi:acetyl/propionyl-CoA carboxylase alpha subunit